MSEPMTIEALTAERDAFMTVLAGIDDLAVLRKVALKQFDIRQGVHALIVQTEQMEQARVQREASHAVSAALDWTAQSRRPSHAELQRRRGEAAWAPRR